MPSFFSIPLRAQTPERFSISLGRVDYQLTVQWRDAGEGGWVVDLADSGGKPILQGVPLVTGADLLAQYRHLNFGGRLWVQTLSSPDAVPTFENLGSDGLLYWVQP